MTASLLAIAPFAWLTVVLIWAWVQARRERALSRFLEALPGIVKTGESCAARLALLAVECAALADRLRVLRELVPESEELRS